METKKKKHIVLVHGMWHGAWCWYKLVPLLKLAGHRVTALDLGASGVNPKRLDELHSLSDYVQPLMDFMVSLPQDERVILVGHSYGGLCISLAMENFPQKILAAVFVTAYMPNCIAPPANLVKRIKFDRDQPTSASFGPKFLETVMYQNCQQEDLELAKMLLRPTGFFIEDFDKEFMLTEAKYGSVNRVFVVCEEDRVMNEDFQRWLIDNSPAKEAKLISGGGHMVMLSKPQELCQCLL